MSTKTMTNFGLPIVKSLASATIHAEKMNHNRENRLMATVGILQDLELQTIQKMDKEMSQLKSELSKMRIRMRHGKRKGPKKPCARVIFQTDSPQSLTSDKSDRSCDDKTEESDSNS